MLLHGWVMNIKPFSSRYILCLLRNPQNITSSRDPLTVLCYFVFGNMSANVFLNLPGNGRRDHLLTGRFGMDYVWMTRPVQIECDTAGTNLA
jgi:hypothetical protein